MGGGSDTQTKRMGVDEGVLMGVIGIVNVFLFSSQRRTGDVQRYLFLERPLKLYYDEWFVVVVLLAAAECSAASSNSAERESE